MAEKTYDYDQQYFEWLSESSRRSAERILPCLVDMCHVRSILDVGCGVGAWLSAARAHGLDDVLGVDGPWVIPAQLEIPESCFQPVTLGADFDLGRRFDLAICLEVIEHLPAESAAPLIDVLIRHAPIVLFSAAVPDQGGDGHVNETWASHWRAHFAARGYACFDPVRRKFWSDQAIDVWYRQNTRLFVCEQRMAANPELFDRLSSYPPLLDDLVHPELFEQRAREVRELRQRNDELARWGAQLQQRIARYQAFPPIALARWIRQLARKVSG